MNKQDLIQKWTETANWYDDRGDGKAAEATRQCVKELSESNFVEKIRVKCHNCHEPFVTEIILCHEQKTDASAARYCDSCLLDLNPLARLETRSLTPKQLQKQHAGTDRNSEQ